MGFFRFFLGVFFFRALAVLGVWGVKSLAFGGGLGVGLSLNVGFILNSSDGLSDSKT
jgi:hypothetical protein